MEMVNSTIGQILNSENPQASFNEFVNSNPEAKNAMDLINQYGNGNPRTAFMNYMKVTSKQTLGQRIMQFFGFSK